MILSDFISIKTNDGRTKRLSSASLCPKVQWQALFFTCYYRNSISLDICDNGMLSTKFILSTNKCKVKIPDGSY